MLGADYETIFSLHVLIIALSWQEFVDGSEILAIWRLVDLKHFCYLDQVMKIFLLLQLYEYTFFTLNLYSPCIINNYGN